VEGQGIRGTCAQTDAVVRSTRSNRVINSSRPTRSGTSAQDDGAAGPLRPAVGTEEYAQTGGVDRLETGQVEDQLTVAGVHRLGEREARVCRGDHVQPAVQGHDGAGLDDTRLGSHAPHLLTGPHPTAALAHTW